MGWLRRGARAYEDRRWVRNNVYEIAITGMLIGLNLVSKVIFDFVPVIPPFITVSPTYFVIAVSCYLLRMKRYGLSLVLISPWLWFVSGHAVSVNVADFVMEYWAPVILVWPMCLVSWFEKRGGFPGWAGWLAAFAFLVVNMAGARLVLTTYAGVLWYKTTWVGSLIYNWPNMYVDLALSVLLFSATYVAFFRLRKVIR